MMSDSWAIKNEVSIIRQLSPSALQRWKISSTFGVSRQP